MSGGDWKAMFKAIQQNDLELVKFYLKSGIDPDYQHPEFMALPINESIRYNHLEITKLLLENGASLLITEMESSATALEIAKKVKNQKAIDLLNAFI